MYRILKIILAIPRTLWFNLRYLSLREAIKLPVWIAPNVRVKSMWRGGIDLGCVKMGIVRIGFHEADGIDTYSSKTIIDIRHGGQIKFLQDAHIGHGAIFCVKSGGKFIVGKNFAVSGTTSFICQKLIEIGDDVQFSWASNVMDTNAHTVYDENGKANEIDGRIYIGNHVWIGAKTTLMKGAYIPDGCVVGIGSMLNKRINDKNCLIAGSPARIIKKIGGWHL